jgi:hypothetical protein
MSKWLKVVPRFRVSQTVADMPRARKIISQTGTRNGRT